jgi:small subunit ribosomal protein S9
MAKDTKYIEAVGRRKTSTARVRITPSSKHEITVNGKSVAEYFPTEVLQQKVGAPLRVEELEQKFVVSAKVTGGGIVSQSEAIRHGIARALIKFEEGLRNPRMKERRKFGLKKARRAPQWSKR